MGNQKGFTLIELVVVIVVLGILSVIAIPKFVDMRIEARKAAVKGAKAALQSAAVSAHALALVKEVVDTSGEADSVTMEGADVGLEYGYPAATSTGIQNAVTIDGFVWSAADTLSLAGKDGTTAIANCHIVYAHPTAANGVPTYDVTDDCTE